MEPDSRQVEYKGDIDLRSGDLRPITIAPLDDISTEAIRAMGEIPHVRMEDCADTDCVLIRSASSFRNPEDFQRRPRMMALGRLGVGVENINMREAARAGVSTFNTPTMSMQAVAQHVVAIAASVACCLQSGTTSMKGHRWDKKQEGKKRINLTQVNFGIVGYGNIGETVHRAIERLVGKVLFADALDIPGKIPLKQLLEQTRIVSLHVPSIGRPLLGKDELALMQPGSVLINTARGDLVDPKAILEAMDRGVLYATDVYTTEGIDGKKQKNMFLDDPTVAPIVDHPNCVICTPHVAASDEETQNGIGREAVDIVRQFVQHGTLNPNNTRGHTLPRVALENGRKPGVHGLFIHPDQEGAMGDIGNSIGRQHVNIGDSITRKGRDGLAATHVEMETEDHDAALKVSRLIEALLHPLHTRLMRYGYVS